MGLSRRNALIGLGGLIAGGGALVGTGAFTTVQAERTVSVETAGDASAFLALLPTNHPDSVDGNDPHPNGQYASISDSGSGTLQLDIGGGSNGLNLNARTTIRNIFQVTNNGTQEVTSLELAFTGYQGSDGIQGNFNFGDTFQFTVDDPPNGDGDQAIVSAPSGTPSSPPSSGVDILGSDFSLNPGESIWVGLEIDLVDGGDTGTDPRDLPNGNYSLEITANTA